MVDTPRGIAKVNGMNTIRFELHPKARKLLASLPRRGLNVHTETYEFAKALETLGLVTITRSARTGHVNVERTELAVEVSL